MVVIRAGKVLVVLGALTLAWAVVVWRWQDPFTALYTMYEQHELARSYDRRVARFATSPPATSLPAGSHPATPSAPHPRIRGQRRPTAASEQQAVLRDAREYRLDSHEGEALGRILVPRMGVNMIFVDGTSEASLEKGPGRDLRTYMPGEHRLVYIAGHRTTFLAPFSDITSLRRGDRVTLELPYATFDYAVIRHVIVSAADMAVLRSGRDELLALQACHPRFFATHRYIVYARLLEVRPSWKRAVPYAVGREAPTT